MIWIINSGASDNICSNLDCFVDCIKVEGQPHWVTILDGTQVKVEILGTVKLCNGLTLKNVLYVPNFCFNLKSISKLIKDLNCCVFSDTNGCFIQGSLMRKHFHLGKAEHGLYFLQDQCKNAKTQAFQWILSRITIRLTQL